MCPQELDANGDGSISQIEFIKGLRKNPILAQKLEMPSVIHQESESRTLFQQAFHEIDVDESKTISQDEFLAFYRPLSALPSGSWKAYDWRPEDNAHPAQQMHTEQEPFVREDTYEQPPSQAVPQAGVPHATSQREQPQPQDQYVPFHPATENSHVEHPQAEEQKLPSEYGDNRHAVARYLQADDLPPLPKVGNTPSYLPENMQVQIPAPSPGFKPNANSVPPAGFEKVQDSFPEIKKGPDIKVQRNAPIPLAPKSSGLNPGLEANRMSSSPSINLRSQAPTLLTRGASQAHQSNSSNLPISTEQLRHKLISFYARVCPARLDKVASFVSHFEGRLINAQEIIDLNTELLETYGYDLNSYVYINYDAEILSDVISTSRQSWPPLRSPQTLPSMSHVRQSPTISARQQMEWSMSPEMVTVPIPGMSHRGMSSPSPGPRYSASSFSMPSFVHPTMSVPSISFPKRSSSPGFISARDFEDIPTASTNPSTFREWEFGGLPSQSSTFREGPVIMSPRSLEAPLFRSPKVQSSTETKIIPASQSSAQFADSHPAEDPVPILPPPQPRSQRLQRSIPGFSPKAVVSTPDMAMVKVASPALQHVPGTTPPVQEETSAIAVPAPPQPELEDAAKPMMLEAPPPQQTSKLRGAIGKVMQGNRAAKMFNEGKHGEAWATRMMAEEEQMLAQAPLQEDDHREDAGNEFMHAQPRLTLQRKAPSPQRQEDLEGLIDPNTGQPARAVQPVDDHQTYTPSRPSRPQYEPPLRKSYNELVGVGLLLEKTSGGSGSDVEVVDIVPEFAAAESNQFDVTDIILSIDGVPVSGLPLQEIKNLTIGRPGTDVTFVMRSLIEVRERVCGVRVHFFAS